MHNIPNSTNYNDSYNGISQYPFMNAIDVKGLTPMVIASAGGRGASAGLLDAISAAPTTGGDPLLDASATVPYHTTIEFLDNISSRDVTLNLLITQLAINKPAQSQADVVLNIEFIAPDVPELIEVYLSAPSFQETSGSYRRTLVIYKGEDSEPILFPLRLLGQNREEKELRLDFYHLGYPIGSATFEVT